MAYFFQAGAPFSIENAKLWPVLAMFSYFVTNLGTFGAPFTGLDSVVVPKNQQIWGMGLGEKFLALEKYLGI